MAEVPKECLKCTIDQSIPCPLHCKHLGASVEARQAEATHASATTEKSAGTF